MRINPFNPEYIKKLATQLVVDSKPNFLFDPEVDDSSITYEFDFDEVNPLFVKYLKSLGTNPNYEDLGNDIRFIINYKGHKHNVAFYIARDKVVFEKMS